MLGLIGALSPILDRVLGAFLPDPVKRQEVVLTILGQLQASDQAQMAVNAAEAGHASVFVAAGGRSSAGAAAAVAFQYVVAPLAVWVSTIAGHPLPAPPALDAVLWELMFGMLGMGALRSYEKIKGVAR